MPHRFREGAAEKDSAASLRSSAPQGTAEGRSRIEVPVRAGALLRRTVILLVTFEAILVLMDVVLNRSGIVPSKAFRRIFNIAYDNSLAGWFSSVQAFLTAQIALAVGWLRARRGSGREGLGWYAVGLFFLYLSADDAAKIHERLGTTFDTLASSGRLAFLSGYPSYTWQVTVGPLLVGGALFVAVFLWRRSRTIRQRDLLLLALFCLASAVLLDAAEGTKGAYQWVARHSWFSPFSVSHYFRVLEEFLEMLGITFFLVLLLDVLLEDIQGVFFSPPGGRSDPPPSARHAA